jgi:thymidylate kinase
MLGSFKYGGIRRRGGIVMFDRHYIDMIVHPNRFSMSLSSRIMLWFYKFIPKPECTYFLYCTPEEIFERKHEFSASEIIQQTNSYMAIGKEIHSFAPIHTNSTIAIEIDEILSHLVIDEK